MKGLLNMPICAAITTKMFLLTLSQRFVNKVDYATSMQLMLGSVIVAKVEFMRELRSGGGNFQRGLLV